MKLARLFPAFSTSFAVIYAFALYYNWALVTYHPAINQWDWGAVPPKSGPTMYWYGIIATTTIGALVVSAIAALLPESLTRRVWSGLTWLVPVAVLAFIAYILRPYFLR
jgi:hypothetical protein